MKTTSSSRPCISILILLSTIGCTKDHTLNDLSGDGAIGTDSGTDIDSDTTTDSNGGPVTFLTDDPFGDGASFSFVFSYLEQIWFGPNGNGTGAAHMPPGGTTTTQVTFSFEKDVQGDNIHQNSCEPCTTYTAIGSVTCQKNTPLCGPDNEDGRGLFASGRIVEDNWLVLAGAFKDAAADNEMHYVYVTRDSKEVLGFSYIDLSEVLGAHTLGCSAMHIFKDRIYLGFPDSGGKRPYLTSIMRLPTASPGMDARGNGDRDEACDPDSHDACTLMAHELPGIGASADTAMIDSIADFNERLYIANNGGIVRSTLSEPLDAHNHPDHWKEITPSDAAYGSLSSITTSKTADIEPADKAVPGMVSFQDKFFFARNTVSGPQLWSCEPSGTGSETDCDSDDWRLVAPNARNNTSLTQFNNTHNVRISLLQADEQNLYVGFDNETDGVVLFRTKNPNVKIASDFQGDRDCAADQGPLDCPGLSGNGFGSADNTRIFSSTMASYQGTVALYLVVGNASIPARVYAQIRPTTDLLRQLGGQPPS